MSGHPEPAPPQKPLRKVEAEDLASDFLWWWETRPERAEALAGDLTPYSDLLPRGRFSWTHSRPVREGDVWRSNLLFVSGGTPIYLREGALVMSIGVEGAEEVNVSLGPVQKYEGLRAAVRLLERYTEVPIPIPSLPAEFAYDPRRFHISLDYPRYGTLGWTAPDGRRLIANYGSAWLNRCGGGPPEEVKVGERRGITYAVKGRRNVVWPANRRHETGSYGLGGKWDLDQLLEWADGMEDSIYEELPRLDLAGC